MKGGGVKNAVCLSVSQFTSHPARGNAVNQCVGMFCLFPMRTLPFGQKCARNLSGWEIAHKEEKRGIFCAKHGAD